MPLGRPRSVLLSLSAAVAVGSLALLALPGGAGASPAGAPGNNGTVKIHEGAGEPAPETRNEPQVCTFHVHALFFDPGQKLAFTVTSWPPTGDRTVVRTGAITVDDTGEGRTAGEYALPDGHYRLTVDTGNGTPTQDKHKMFWVRCENGGGGGGSSDEGGGDESDSDESDSDESGGDEGGVYKGVAPTPTVSPSPTPAPVVDAAQPAAPAALAETGVPALLPIAGLGLAMLLAGVALAAAPLARARR
jgi:hypothetical protein